LGFSNIATEFEAIGGNTHISGGYGNNMLTDVRGVDNGNVNGDFVQVFLDIVHAAVGEKNQQDSLKYLPCGYFSVVKMMIMTLNMLSQQLIFCLLGDQVFHCEMADRA